MRNIKINERQDKEIRELIKEGLNLNPAANLSQLQGAIGNNSNAEATIGVDFNDKVSNIDRLDIAEKGASAINTPVSTELSTPQNPELDVKIEPDKKKTTVGESFIISKSQLDEIRLKNLKENSEVVKIKDFLK